MRTEPPPRSRSVAGQAATETMLTMSFLMLLIFATVQLTWWSNFKYGANLGAFAAQRTAMVGGTPSDQLIAARQVVNVRERRRPGQTTMQLRLPPLVPMTRTIRGGGGGLPGLPTGLLNNLLPTFNNLLNVFQRIPGLIPPTAPDRGGASTGAGGASGGSNASTANVLGGIGGLGGVIGSLPINSGFLNGIGSMLGNTLNNLLGGFGGSSRTRRGLGYVINAAGGYPIQDGVRLVGWSHVTEQPLIGESGDNAGGFFGGFGGFSWGLGGLLGGLPGVPGMPPLPPGALQNLQHVLNQQNNGGTP